MQTDDLLAPANLTSLTSVALILICVKFCIPNEVHENSCANILKSITEIEFCPFCM